MTSAKKIFLRLKTQMRLHHSRIPATDRRYRLHRLDDPAQLDSLFTCYRSTARQVECSIRNPLARPMRVRDVRDRLAEFSPANQQAFFDYVNAFNVESGKPIELTLPAYDLGKDGYLLLDGNHRATAAAVAGRPITVTLAVLEAPIDRRILIDLKYWDGGPRRFAARLKRICTLRREARGRIARTTLPFC